MTVTKRDSVWSSYCAAEHILICREQVRRACGVGRLVVTWTACFRLADVALTGSCRSVEVTTVDYVGNHIDVLARGGPSSRCRPAAGLLLSLV
jgi:hypothetical protein